MATILIVDDEDVTLALVSEILSAAGHRILTARNGHEAIELLDREKSIRVLVTDLRMPGFNGLRLIRDRREAGDMIPIIAMSGVNADQLILAEDYGANATLLKPIDRDKLLAAVDRSLDQARSLWSDAWIHPEFGSLDDG